MAKTRKIGLAFLMAAAAFYAYAQDSSSLKPEFTTDMTFSSGIMNIDENATVDEVPGVSSEYNADIKLKLKGKFSRASEYGVEKEDGIEWKSKMGYEAGLTADAAMIYNSIADKYTTSTSNNSNHYSRIQPMIDWYEANMSKYGLPADPCGAGTPWPTTSYGASDSRYQFIHGSEVEDASNVNWTSKVWGDAECLYTDIKYFISRALDQLYSDRFATGEISQATYSSLDAENKNYAELKMRAIREFDAVVDGTSTTSIADAFSAAYVKITNIGGFLDARVDFLGKRITTGNNIFSYIAGQNKGGAAVTLNMKQGLVPGLEAEVSTGISGGVAQNPEDYDTDVLDYYKGLSGEWALGGKARYTAYFDKIGSTLQVTAGGVWSDILVANQNWAADASLKWTGDGFVSYGADCEFMALNYKDREDANAAYKMAFSGLANARVRAYGIALEGMAQYKTAGFEHKLWTAEDRFYGYSCDSDYYIANAESAMKFRGTLKLNPQYFLGYDILDVACGAEGFLYGDSFAMNGLGIFGKASLSIEDLTGVPVSAYAAYNYYKNSALTTWDDYESLPAQTLMDFSTYKFGLKFSPVKYFDLSAEYSTSPSKSRRNAERISSFSINGTVKFD